MTKARTKRSGRGWWIVAAASLLVLLICIGIIWAAAQNDSDGNPWIENPGAVLIGFFSTLGMLGSGVIAKLSTIQAPLKVITDNVQNDHRDEDGKPILLRDDQDRMHAESIARQDELESGVNQRLAALQAVVLDALSDVKRDIGGLRAENRDDRDDTNTRIAALDRRMQHIEQKGTS